MNRKSEKAETCMEDATHGEGKVGKREKEREPALSPRMFSGGGLWNQLGPPYSLQKHYSVSKIASL
jgi:hypothetical protein